MKRMKESSRLGTALIALSLLGCAAEVESPEIDDTREELVLDGEDWDRIREFESTSFDEAHIAALYGRAVAKLDADGGLTCSAWLIDDDIMVSAHHCRGERDLRGDYWGTATFGRFGDEWTNTDAGRVEAIRQATSLGLGSEAATAFGDGDLTRFRCRVVDTEYRLDGRNRDVDYWQCEPNRIRGHFPPLPGGARTMPIYPGHIWGHINVENGSRDDGDPLYMLSHNRRRDTPSGGMWQVMLSPRGYVYDAHDDAPGIYDTNFEVGRADNRCGSSGGAILDPRTHRAFGVIQGQYRAFWDDKCYSGPESTGSIYSNIGTYIHRLANEYAEDRPPRTTAMPHIRSHPSSQWVGGSGGDVHAAACPDDYAVIGVIGESVSDSEEDPGVVGDFGVICAPWSTPGASSPDIQLDRATIISGGSRHTGFGLVDNADFNTRHHETLVPGIAHRSNGGRERFQTCPAGSYLSGLEARADSSLNRVSMLRCTHMTEIITGSGPTTTESTSWNRLAQPIGHLHRGATVRTECEEREVAAGVIIRSGWHTDGMMLICQQVH